MGNNLRSAIFLAGKGKIRAALGRIVVPDWRGYMLLNAFLQSWNVVLLSIFPIFKLLLSNLFNLIYVDKRNFFTV